MREDGAGGPRRNGIDCLWTDVCAMEKKHGLHRQRNASKEKKIKAKEGRGQNTKKIGVPGREEAGRIDMITRTQRREGKMVSPKPGQTEKGKKKTVQEVRWASNSEGQRTTQGGWRADR